MTELRLALTATELALVGERIHETHLGSLDEAVRAHLTGEGPGGLVLLGSFGSGKTSLCQRMAAEQQGCTAVPLRVVARSQDVTAGLLRAIGPTRLEQARRGERVLLLDGLDEVPAPVGGLSAWLDELLAVAGPRWMLTSRPGHFRTDAGEPHPEQLDVFGREGVRLARIDPLARELVRDVLGKLPNGQRLLWTVEGLEDLATSPILLHVVHAALPFIEPGRPIQAWGVFDAWIRSALSTGPNHGAAVHALEELAWSGFERWGADLEGGAFSREEVARHDIPQSLRNALLVSDLDGQQRFGHRSVWEFLVASRIAPKLRANQGYGPDELSGRRISEAMRAFLVGRCGAMPVHYGDDRVLIPRGNFIAGGDNSPDERPLRIQHLRDPVWIARMPVTNRDWAAYLETEPDHRIDAHYLPHWGTDRRMPEGSDHMPVYGVWPEDADKYAAFAKGRLPTADEWEKAVRGLDGRRWPWGDHWRKGEAVTAELGVQRPLPVTAFGAHGDAGLFSAVGGVFEYTSSGWRGRTDRGRVVMGGCYTHPAPVSRAGLRLSHTLSGYLKAGLRLAWDADHD
ncbi:MAG: hypothetical protein EP330_05690 [Deltaproteobacteria bacterium]|nr:MAG: hypothetical protein EP330_05690 [Deltaproteobacteria bacterium]